MNSRLRINNDFMNYIPKKLSLYILMITGVISFFQISLIPAFFQEFIFSSRPTFVKYIKNKSEKFCKKGSFNGISFAKESIFSLLCELNETK